MINALQKERCEIICDTNNHRADIERLRARIADATAEIKLNDRSIKRLDARISDLGATL